MMGDTPKTPLFFEDKPLFGMDIGSAGVRVLQLEHGPSVRRVVGYGSIRFAPDAVTEGVIVDPEQVAQAVHQLFSHHLTGDITTHRVAFSIPVSRAFTRSLRTPLLPEKELAESVRTEIEQYVPFPIDDLITDYDSYPHSKTETDLFAVAVPRRIVQSRLDLLRILGLEPVLAQTTIGAGAELFAYDAQSDAPSLLIDFGGDSADISVINHGIVVSATVSCGGKQIDSLLVKALDVSPHEAALIKTKYGLGFSKKQQQIVRAIGPLLGGLVKEVRRTIRYYDERADKGQSISQVLIMGGGANMPGLADYLTNELRLAVRSFDPGHHMDFGRLQPFAPTERMSFVTASGLAVVRPEKVFA